MTVAARQRQRRSTRQDPPCPVTHCHRTTGGQRYPMCRAHWMRVPKLLQVAFYQAADHAREVLANPSASEELRLEAIAKRADARTACVRWVED